MFHFLGFLFIIIIAILIIGLSVIGTIFKALFGFGRRPASTRSSGTQANNRNSSGQQQTYNEDGTETDSYANDEKQTYEERTRHRKKIFSKDEGEYVDFEEVK